MRLPAVYRCFSCFSGAAAQRCTERVSILKPVPWRVSGEAAGRQLSGCEVFTEKLGVKCQTTFKRSHGLNDSGTWGGANQLSCPLPDEPGRGADRAPGGLIPAVSRLHPTIADSSYLELVSLTPGYWLLTLITDSMTFNPHIYE